VISPTQRKLLDNTQHSQEADISASDRIRTRISKKRAATAPRLRPRCHWNPKLHWDYSIKSKIRV